MFAETRAHIHTRIHIYTGALEVTRYILQFRKPHTFLVCEKVWISEFDFYIHNSVSIPTYFPLTSLKRAPAVVTEAAKVSTCVI